MIDIMAIINEKYQADLENIWDEAEKERGSETKELLRRYGGNILVKAQIFPWPG